ncbi:hypothetical protein PUN28_017982 [Cardiocondyla obscurior]|uniref:Uncharacterized protein n=1 Tax=Cardiocondyla obscurior TaxID=286306 RepID=A0AAW2EJU3_9HYME
MNKSYWNCSISSQSNIYRVFNLEKKIVEKVGDVTIKDETNTVDEVLFPIPSEEQEKDLEELEHRRKEDDLLDQNLTKNRFRDDIVNKEPNVRA